MQISFRYHTALQAKSMKHPVASPIHYGPFCNRSMGVLVEPCLKHEKMMRIVSDLTLASGWERKWIICLMYREKEARQSKAMARPGLIEAWISFLKLIWSGNSCIYSKKWELVCRQCLLNHVHPSLLLPVTVSLLMASPLVRMFFRQPCCWDKNITKSYSEHQTHSQVSHHMSLMLCQADVMKRPSLFQRPSLLTQNQSLPLHGNA